jgi:hypothetical protein
MSSRMRLGVSDTHSRLLGIRLQQIFCGVVGLTFLSDAVLIKGGIEALLIAVTAFCCLIPIRKLGTVGEVAWIALRYCVRRRNFVWSRRSKHLYELRHIGRLDLAGLDSNFESSLKLLATTLSLESEVSEFQVALVRSCQGSQTLVSTSSASNPGELWKTVEPHGESLMAREFWSELRVGDSYFTFLSFNSFSLSTRNPRFFNQFLAWLPSGSVILTTQVLGAQKALRISARAAHQSTIDSSVTQGVGFRTTIRGLTHMQRKGQQEREVESGATLLRIGVHLLCWGSTRKECRARVKLCVAEARRSGLPLRARYGEQRLFARAIEPGFSGV